MQTDPVIASLDAMLAELEAELAACDTCHHPDATCQTTPQAPAKPFQKAVLVA